MSAKIRTEITVNVQNRPGELARVMEILARAGVNILAFCGYAEGNTSGKIRLIPDHDGKARKALEAEHLNYSEGAVVAVMGGSGKGAGAKLVVRLAKAGINIDYAYAGTSGDGKSIAVFKVPDPERALKELVI